MDPSGAPSPPSGFGQQGNDYQQWNDFDLSGHLPELPDDIPENLFQNDPYNTDENANREIGNQVPHAGFEETLDVQTHQDVHTQPEVFWYDHGADNPQAHGGPEFGYADQDEQGFYPQESAFDTEMGYRREDAFQPDSAFQTDMQTSNAFDNNMALHADTHFQGGPLFHTDPPVPVNSQLPGPHFQMNPQFAGPHFPIQPSGNVLQTTYPAASRIILPIQDALLHYQSQPVFLIGGFAGNSLGLAERNHLHTLQNEPVRYAETVQIANANSAILQGPGYHGFPQNQPYQHHFVDQQGAAGIWPVVDAYDQEEYLDAEVSNLEASGQPEANFSHQNNADNRSDVDFHAQMPLTVDEDIGSPTMNNIQTVPNNSAPTYTHSRSVTMPSLSIPAPAPVSPSTPAPAPTQGPGNDTRRRAASHTHRQPRVRQIMPRSDPIQRLPATHPIRQQAITVGHGTRGGINQLAFFGGETVARTIHPLTVERGRVGRAGSSAYPSADTVLPARLTLAEICRLYPNHVWGSLLRVFIAEGWTAEQVWQALPASYRHNEASTRPWNYLQAAFGRETDQMTREETGRKRIPKKRKVDADSDDGVPAGSQPGSPPLASPDAAVPSLASLPTLGTGPVLPPLSPDPAMHQTGPAADMMALQELQNNVELRRQRIMAVLLQTERFLGRSDSENRIRQATMDAYRLRLTTWTQGVVDRLAGSIPGEDLSRLNPPALLRRAFEIQNPALPTETPQEYRARAMWYAWRRYLDVVTSWLIDCEQERDELVQMTQDIYRW